MEAVKFKYLKLLLIYSFITGGTCALISLIPNFMPFFSLFFIPVLGAIAPILILILKDGFESSDNKTFAFLGAVCGFCLSLSYIIILSPLVSLIHFINKSYYDYGVQYLNLFLFALFFVMISIVYIITNTVTGLLTGIIYRYIKGSKYE